MYKIRSEFGVIAISILTQFANDIYTLHPYRKISTFRFFAFRYHVSSIDAEKIRANKCEVIPPDLGWGEYKVKPSDPLNIHPAGSVTA